MWSIFLIAELFFLRSQINFSLYLVIKFLLLATDVSMFLYAISIISTEGSMGRFNPKGSSYEYFFAVSTVTEKPSLLQYFAHA